MDTRVLSVVYSPDVKPIDFTNHFPTKSNKKYMLKIVRQPGTCFIDLMFDDPMCYLICINANTRYLVALPTNLQYIKGDKMKYGTEQKLAILIIPLLEWLIKGVKVNYLIGDSEKAFASKAAVNLYKENYIIFY